MAAMDSGDKLDIEVFTVKATLVKYCSNAAVIQKFRDDVAEMSSLFVEASVYINFCLYRDWANGVFPTEPYDFLPFYYDLLHGSKSKYDLDLEYASLRNTHLAQEHRLYDRRYRSNLFVAEAAQFATIFHNNLWMHAYNRLRTFFYRFTSDKAMVYQTLDYLFTEDSTHQPSPLLIANAQLYLDYDTDMRFYDITAKDKYHKYIEFYYRLLQFNLRNNIKTFKLVPILKHGAHHCQYDSLAFHSLLSSLKLIQGTRSDMPNSEWFKYFGKCRELERAGRTSFGFSIKTDGESVSFSMNRYVPKRASQPDAKKRKEEEQEEDKMNNAQTIQNVRERGGRYTNVVGLDSGLKLMFGGIRYRVCDGTRETIKISSRHYHHLAGKNVREERRKRIIGVEANSTVAPSDYLPYTIHRLREFRAKQAAYSQRPITKMKFEKFRQTERAAKTVAHQIVGGGKSELRRKQQLRNLEHRSSDNHRTLVLLGDATVAANSPMRGYIRTPNKKIVKHLSNIADIVRVNEFR